MACFLVLLEIARSGDVLIQWSLTCSFWPFPWQSLFWSTSQSILYQKCELGDLIVRNIFVSFGPLQPNYKLSSADHERGIPFGPARQLSLKRTWLLFDNKHHRGDIGLNMVSLSKLRSWCENSKCPSQGLQRIEPHPWLSGSESTRPCCNLSDAYPYWEWSLKPPLSFHSHFSCEKSTRWCPW